MKLLMPLCAVALLAATGAEAKTFSRLKLTFFGTTGDDGIAHITGTTGILYGQNYRVKLLTTDGVFASPLFEAHNIAAYYGAQGGAFYLDHTVETVTSCPDPILCPPTYNGGGDLTFFTDLGDDSGIELFDPTPDHAPAKTGIQTVLHYDFSVATSHRDAMVAMVITPVPEPATWALMIAGFGFVGAMCRRRGRLAV